MASIFEPYVLRASASRTLPAIALDAARVSVVLGANGTGKTRLAQRAVDAYRTHHGATHVTYIEGARNFSDLVNVGVGAEFSRIITVPHEQRESYKGHRSVTLSQRVLLALKTLRIDQLANEISWAREMKAWSTDRSQPTPADPAAPLDEAFALFQTIFPQLKLEVTSSEQLYCRKNGGDQYPLIQASDGEKLVFALICEAVANGNDEVVFVVDEPEAHLNPLLACRVWDILEERLAHCQFVYTTHCASFAMRNSVGALFILEDDSQVTPVSGFTELPSGQQEHFLGALPLVVNWKRAIATEGDDLSFDSRFYPAILEQNDIAVVPLGSKNDVLAETSRLSLWKRLAPTARILGIVDNDNSEGVGDVDTILALGFNEAESYLCHPEVAAAVAEACFGKDDAGARAEFRRVIVNEATKARLVMISQIATRGLLANYSVSVSARAVRQLQDDQALILLLKAQASAAQQAAKDQLTEANIHRAVAAAAKKVDSAIAAVDVEVLLAMLPGKELLQFFIPLVGVKGIDEYLNAFKKHVVPKKLPVIVNLRDEILGRLAP